MSSSGYRSGQADGDESAKNFEAGANSAMSNAEMSTGVHETAAQKAPAGEKTTGTGTSVLDSSGAIGKQFTTQGALGGMAQKVGGPFHEQGSIGQQFTEKGAIGGAVQNNLGDQKKF